MDYYFIIIMTIILIVSYFILKDNDEYINGCQNDFTHSLVSKFYNEDLASLGMDILSLIFLYELEKNLKFRDMAILFTIAILFISAVETILQHYEPGLVCKNGMFPVFAALGTYDGMKMVHDKYVITLVLISAAVIYYMLSTKNYHFMSDFVGFFTGFLLALVF